MALGVATEAALKRRARQWSALPNTLDESNQAHIEWTPTAARFYVDGALLRSFSERIDLFGLPQNVLLTIWASSSPDWAGAVTSETTGASVAHDWVEVYEYRP